MNFRAFGVPIYDEEWYRDGTSGPPRDLQRYIRSCRHAACRSAGCISMATTEKRRRRPAWTCLPSAALSRIAHEEISRSSPRYNFDRKDLHRVDVRFSRRFSLNGRFSVEPLVEVFNVFNRANFNVEPEREQQQLRTAAAGRWRQQRCRWNRVPAARRPARLQGHVLTTANLQVGELGVGSLQELGVGEVIEDRAGYNFRSAPLKGRPRRPAVSESTGATYMKMTHRP